MEIRKGWCSNEVRGSMVWGCAQIFVPNGRGSPTFSDLWLGVIMVFIFGMMFDVVEQKGGWLVGVCSNQSFKFHFVLAKNFYTKTVTGMI